MRGYPYLSRQLGGQLMKLQRPFFNEGVELAKLLENNSVARHLKQRQPDVLAEFEATVKTVSLD